MKDTSIEDRYALADFITNPASDTYWISPISRDASQEYLVELPDQYDTVEPSYRIADIGAGNGDLTVALADRYPEADVTGIDIAPRYAQQNVEEYREETGRDNAQVIGGDAYEILPNLEPFDFVYAVNVYQDTADFASAVETTTNAVRDNGYIGATFTDDEAKHLFDDHLIYDEETDAEYWEFNDVTIKEDTTVSFYQRIIPESEAVATFGEYGFEPVEREELEADKTNLEEALKLMDPDNSIDTDELKPSYPFYLFRGHGGDQ